MVIELILYGFSIASCSNEIAYVCEQTSLFKPAFLLVMFILETPDVCLNSNPTNITRGHGVAQLVEALRVRLPIVSLEFFLGNNPSGHTMDLGST